ncbi:hypothetical protein OS175_12475 [Marinicella sp. S1101]|uniref:hypothetical protein n=1 Tax=Marinicella marina TaxID=2996016 RepID=UPI002260BDE3|nr:hypothetical protein [Marinicella marina]MCX7554697.1 hypothetical protein [Marinicella marina]MDJ1141487.1 hypothetical protein [Marinicella marina]
MKIALSFILLLSLASSSLATTTAANSDAAKRVKAKFLVSYKDMCVTGGQEQQLDQATIETKCACQVKQFDENLTGDEIIRLFSSSDKYLYPKLRNKANTLIKQCG